MKDLKRGTKGADVKLLQGALNKAGARPALVLDGTFGKRTEAALKLYQKKARLKADGIAGAASLAALGLARDAAPWHLPEPSPTRRDVDAHYVKARKMARTAIGLAEANHCAIVYTIKHEMEKAAERLDAVYAAVVDTLSAIDVAHHRFEKLSPSQVTKRERFVKQARKAGAALVDRAGVFFDHIIAMGGIESRIETAVRKRKRVIWSLSDSYRGRHKVLTRDFTSLIQRIYRIASDCTDHATLKLRKIGAEAYALAGTLEKDFADFDTSVAHIETLKRMFDDRFLTAPDDDLLSFIAEAKEEWPKYLAHERRLGRTLRAGFELEERHKRAARDLAA